METRFLETFLLVVEHGSLAEASRRLSLTPSAVAQRMQALEEEFGVALLLRSGRRVMPTEAGHAILADTRALVTEARRLRSLASCENAAGELRIGAISTALTGLLPKALTSLLAEQPSLEIFLEPGQSAELYESVNAGRIDAAILVRPPFAIQKTLEWRLLRDEALVLLAPAALQETSVEALLRSQPFLRYDRRSWGGRLADQCLSALGIAVEERAELDSLEAISVMVDAGLGVSIVPRWPRPWPAGVCVAEHALPPPVPSRQIGFLWPRSSRKARLLDLLSRKVTDANAAQASDAQAAAIRRQASSSRSVAVAKEIRK